MKTIVIAEIGHNHNGNMSIAKKLIHLAKDCGATIAKFQLYDTEKLEWGEGEYTRKLYEDLKSSELTRAQLEILKTECDKINIEFMCSVFDKSLVDWTEEINMKRYKIASRSIHDKPLLNKICKTGKDMIISLGWWDKGPFPKIETKGKVDFLYCVSKYPASFEDLDMPMFTGYSGFSDHTPGITASLVAVSRGARIIEKHFTLDRNMPGYDQKASIEPHELKTLVNKIKIIEKIL